MKNLIFSLTFMLVCSFAFAKSVEVKNKTVKQLTVKIVKPVIRVEWTYRCMDGIVVQFECGCTVGQATAMGRAWCNAR